MSSTRLRRLTRVALAGLAGLGLTVGSAAAATGAGATTVSVPHYSFSTHFDPADPTFNQFLAINDAGVIAGYFGIGNADHPNKGYTFGRPYGVGDFVDENFPGSVQTQVTGINDSGTTVGFYADAAGDNFGWVRRGQTWTVVIDPHTTGTINQLLGTNDHGLAVGFYTDAAGHDHSYVFDFHDDSFLPVNIPGALDVTATGINDRGEICGFYNKPGGPTLGFLLEDGHLTSFAVRHSSSTMPAGINDAGTVVGTYAGANPKDTLSFVWQDGSATTVADPEGLLTTDVNGINNHGDLVGFYTDAAGNVVGFEALP